MDARSNALLDSLFGGASQAQQEAPQRQRSQRQRQGMGPRQLARTARLHAAIGQRVVVRGANGRTVRGRLVDANRDVLATARREAAFSSVACDDGTAAKWAGPSTRVLVRADDDVTYVFPAHLVRLEDNS